MWLSKSAQASFKEAGIALFAVEYVLTRARERKLLIAKRCPESRRDPRRISEDAADHRRDFPGQLAATAKLYPSHSEPVD